MSTTEYKIGETVFFNLMTAGEKVQSFKATIERILDAGRHYEVHVFEKGEKKFRIIPKSLLYKQPAYPVAN